MAMRIRRNHLGIGFEIWTDKWTWFWSLSNPHARAGVIGATASGTDAIDEAQMAIEELLERSSIDRSALSPDAERARRAPRSCLNVSESWTRRMDRSAEYLTRVCQEFAAV